MGGRLNVNYIPENDIPMINLSAHIFDGTSLHPDSANETDVMFTMAKHVINAWNLGNVTIKPYVAGRINHTYLIESDKGKFLLQAVNTSVFPDMAVIIRNMLKVCTGLTAQYEMEGFSNDEIKRKAIYIVPTSCGKPYVIYKCRRTDGTIFFQPWRLIEFVQKSRTNDVAHTYDEAKKLGSAVADFHFRINQIPYTLEDSLPGYYDTLKYIAKYEEIKKNDPVKRLCKVTNLAIHKFIESNISRAKSFYELSLDDTTSDNKPYVVKITKTHTDPKGNNVLLDGTTGEVLVLCDWDTLRQEISVALEFGYAVKFLCSTASEDERDPKKIKFNVDTFKGFTDGWIGTLISKGIPITKVDVNYLKEAILHAIWQQCLRFYEDYIDGDRYFRLNPDSDPKSNLFRAQNQMYLWQNAKLLETEIEKTLMNSI